MRSWRCFVGQFLIIQNVNCSTPCHYPSRSRQLTSDHPSFGPSDRHSFTETLSGIALRPRHVPDLFHLSNVHIARSLSRKPNMEPSSLHFPTHSKPISRRRLLHFRIEQRWSFSPALSDDAPSRACEHRLSLVGYFPCFATHTFLYTPLDLFAIPILSSLFFQDSFRCFARCSTSNRPYSLVTLATLLLCSPPPPTLC